MPQIHETDDDFDDEDWYENDEDESYDDAESAPCPECSAPLYDFNDRCSACGYYLTAADRRRLWSKDSKPVWIKVTTIVILLVLIFGLFEISTFFF